MPRCGSHLFHAYVILFAMTPEQLREKFGPEYPAFFLLKDIRIPLHSESRFCRLYVHENTYHGISRFMDGSATITLDELKSEWPTWNDSLRREFTSNCKWLHEHSEYPEMLRFMMGHCGFPEIQDIALSISSYLPQQEAFTFLADTLKRIPLRDSANISQALAQTKHPNAIETLRRHLDRLWSAPGLWDNAKFMNWTAYSTVCNIRHLLELSVPPAEFEEKVRQLSTHACSRLRDSCGRFLTKYYPWLKHPEALE